MASDRPTDKDLQEKALYDIIQYLPLDKMDLKKGYKVLDMSGITSSNCFVEKKEKTLSNFIETGLFSIGNNGLIDNTVKEKLYEEIEERLDDIISEGILRELVEF